MATLMCGCSPSPSDLAKVQEFSAALAQPTRHLLQLAIMEMDPSNPDYANALAGHRMDPEPWSVGDPRDGRSLRSDAEVTGPVEWCEFDPRPGVLPAPGVLPVSASEVLPGFDPPPPPVDAPEPERLTQRERDQLAIANGIHPATRMPLADNDQTCGDCRFLRTKHAGAGKWWKCGTPDPRSKNHRGDGRDMTKRWPACIAFQPKDGDPK